MKLFCKIGIHKYTAWFNHSIDPYEAMEKTKEAARHVFPLLTLQSSNERSKYDWEKRLGGKCNCLFIKGGSHEVNCPASGVTIGEFVMQHMVAYTNKAERYCTRCGHVQVNFPYI